MQNENKAQHWKEKLADTERLSSELQLNKSAAWEKLQQRLQQKPKRWKAIWYWAAAACLLPFVVFLSSTLQQQNHAVAINITNKAATTGKEIKEVKPAQKEMSTLAASASPLKKKAVIKKKINDEITLAVTEEKKNDIIVDSIISHKAEIVVATVDSTEKIPVAIQIKKKLKVVHINELGEPDKEAIYLARDSHVRSFPLQIAREETYLSPIKTTRRTGFINLKIMSSSN